MLCQSKLNFDGSTRSVSMVSELVVGKQNMSFALVSISYLCFVSNVFASSTVCENVLKVFCFLLFDYCGEPVSFCRCFIEEMEETSFAIGCFFFDLILVKMS